MKKKLLFLVSMFVFSSLVNANTGQNEGKVVSLTKSDFIEKVYDYEKNPDKWVFKGNKPLIIDFYADWCAPCRMLSPVLKSLAEKYKDDIVIYKVNTEKERELSAAFGIRSLPTLLFVPMDEIPQMAQGALPKDIIEKGINEVLLKRKDADGNIVSIE